MPGLTIHPLTDPFALPALLAAALTAPRPVDLLAPVQLVVPGASWRGWLARALADRIGVLAGVELVDLAGFRRQWPAAGAATPARVLAIHCALDQAAAADPALQAWLARDPDGTWRMALADQLAESLAEDGLQRPALFTDRERMPGPWQALLAALPDTVATALDTDAGPAALHWVASAPLLAHDWALLSGLAATRPVSVWLLDPADGADPDPLLALLGPDAPRLPAALTAARMPLPAAPPAVTGALGALRAAWAEGRPPEPLPPGALTVAAAGDVWEQLQRIEAWLTERFAADPTLSPADVLLRSPQLPGAAALVDAVFGSAAGSPWPYRIGGRREPRPAASLLQQLLDHPQARWTPAELLMLLRAPALAAGLGLDADATVRLAAHLPEAGVGWGLDAGSRREHRAGDDPTHSWTAQWPLLAARLAADDPLRQLPRLFAALIADREASRGAQPWSAHAAAFARLLAALLPAPRRHPAADAVWRCWAGLLAELDTAPDLPLSRAAFAALLGPRLWRHAEAAEPAPASAAPEAGLSVAPLRPGSLRPARLIVLFGLDALGFPRRPAVGPLAVWREAVDAAHPALAPPEPAEADRQLLLESLWLAADATLWLYADRDPASGQPLPPPALIEAALRHLPGATRGLPPAPRRPAPTRSADPVSTTTVPADVSLTTFCDCFREPAAFLWTRVRGLAVPPEPLPVDGPLTLTPLAAWQLRTRFLKSLDQTGPATLPAEPDAAALALLPPGPSGPAHWTALRTEALALWQYHQNLLLDGDHPEPIEVDLYVDERRPRLHGRLLAHAGQLIERVAGVPRARHLLHAWLRGLALAAMEVPKADLVLVGWSQRGPMHLVLRLPEPARAQTLLAELLDWYARAWQAPLPFTPELGLALVEGGLRAAHWHWVGNRREPGEAQAPLHRLLWADADPTAPPQQEALATLSRLLLPAPLIHAWREHWT